ARIRRLGGARRAVVASARRARASCDRLTAALRFTRPPSLPQSSLALSTRWRGPRHDDRNRVRGRVPNLIGGSMSQSREPSPTPPPAPVPSHRESASTADGLAAQRAALAERERRTAHARTAARRLEQAAEPRR